MPAYSHRIKYWTGNVQITALLLKLPEKGDTAFELFNDW